MEHCTNGVLDKKVLVSYTHTYLPYLMFHAGLPAGALLAAEEGHRALVVALSDEIVFFACSEV